MATITIAATSPVRVKDNERLPQESYEVKVYIDSNRLLASIHKVVVGQGLVEIADRAPVYYQEEQNGLTALFMKTDPETAQEQFNKVQALAKADHYFYVRDEEVFLKAQNLQGKIKGMPDGSYVIL